MTIPFLASLYVTDRLLSYSFSVGSCCLGYQAESWLQGRFFWSQGLENCNTKYLFFCCSLYNLIQSILFNSQSVFSYTSFMLCSQICSRLKDAGIVEEFDAKVNEKVMHHKSN